MEAWYAFYTKPHCEFLTDGALTTRGLTTYLPLWRPCAAERRELLFPQYLFVCCDLAEQDGSSFRHVAGLADLVTCDGQPVVVPKQAIRLIQEQVRQAEERPVAEPIPGNAETPGLLVGLSAVLQQPMLPSVRTQALTDFLCQVNRPAGGQATVAAPAQGYVQWRTRGTRGHGRRISYRYTDRKSVECNHAEAGTRQPSGTSSKLVVNREASWVRY